MLVVVLLMKIQNGAGKQLQLFHRLSGQDTFIPRLHSIIEPLKIIMLSMLVITMMLILKIS